MKRDLEQVHLEAHQAHPQADPLLTKKQCCHDTDTDSDPDSDDDGWSDLQEMHCGTFQLHPANVLSWTLERGLRPDPDDEYAWQIWNSLTCRDPTHFLPCHCRDCLKECPCLECESQTKPKSKAWDKHLQCWCSLCVPPILQLSKIGSTDMCNNPNCRRPLGEDDEDHYFCGGCLTRAREENLDFCPQCFVMYDRSRGGHSTPACK